MVQIDNMILKYQILTKSDKYCGLLIDLRISEGSPALSEDEKIMRIDVCRTVSSYLISAQSDDYCRL